MDDCLYISKVERNFNAEHACKHSMLVEFTTMKATNHSSSDASVHAVVPDSPPCLLAVRVPLKTPHHNVPYKPGKI